MAEFKPINTQEEFNTAIAERLTREKAKYSDYDDLKAKAAKLAELESKKYDEQINGLQQELTAVKSDLSEKEKNNSELLARAEKAEKTILRQKVAAAHKLPAGIADRISGNTEEEMNKDAETLSGLFEKPDPGAPLGDNTSGDGGKWGNVLSAINN